MRSGGWRRQEWIGYERGAVLMYVFTVEGARRELWREWFLERVEADDAKSGGWGCCWWWRGSGFIGATRALGKGEEGGTAAWSGGGMCHCVRRTCQYPLSRSGSVWRARDRRTWSPSCPNDRPARLGSLCRRPACLQLHSSLAFLLVWFPAVPATATTTTTMDDSIPSIQTAGVGSRFVSQDELEAAKTRRDEQWKAAYAR